MSDILSTDHGCYDLHTAKGQYEYVAERLMRNAEGSNVLAVLADLYRAVDLSAQSAQFTGLADVLTEAATMIVDFAGMTKRLAYYEQAIDLAAQLREWATKLKGN